MKNKQPKKLAKLKEKLPSCESIPDLVEEISSLVSGRRAVKKVVKKSSPSIKKGYLTQWLEDADIDYYFSQQIGEDNDGVEVEIRNLFTGDRFHLAEATPTFNFNNREAAAFRL